MIGVYAICNTLTGKRYIGSSININRRWTAHRCNLRRGSHHSDGLQADWDLCGEQHFTFELLESLNDTNRLVAAEKEWIDRFGGIGSDGLYNRRFGSHGIYNLPTIEARRRGVIWRRKMYRKLFPFLANDKDADDLHRYLATLPMLTSVDETRDTVERWWIGQERAERINPN